MPLTTVAFYEVIDLAGAWGELAAIDDQHIYTDGDDLTVPTLNQIVALAAGIASGGNQLARLVAPSLRGLSLPHINPQSGGADADVEPDADPPVMDLRSNPIALAVGEQLNAQGAQRHDHD